jgi:hypothetical protein
MTLSDRLSPLLVDLKEHEGEPSSEEYLLSFACVAKETSPKASTGTPTNKEKRLKNGVRFSSPFRIN